MIALAAQVEMWRKNGKNWAPRLISLVSPHFRHYLSLEPGDQTPVSTLPCKGMRVSFAEEGMHTMRKIILAAAIATSALGLAACSGETATETEEAVDAMAADAEANADAAAEGAEAAVDATAEGAEAAAEGAADAATEAADAAAATAEAATEAAE
jgi:hypothetical protein